MAPVQLPEPKLASGTTPSGHGFLHEQESIKYYGHTVELYRILRMLCPYNAVQEAFSLMCIHIMRKTHIPTLPEGQHRLQHRMQPYTHPSRLANHHQLQLPPKHMKSTNLNTNLEEKRQPGVFGDTWRAPGLAPSHQELGLGCGQGRCW